MQNALEGFLIRLLVAALLCWVGFLYFGIVLPTGPAIGIALLLATMELFAPMLAGRQGAAIRWLFRVATPLVAWPALAWLALAHITNHGAAVTAAAAGASLVGLAAAGHGQGNEHARAGVALVASLIPFIALLEALRSGNVIAASVGCIAVAAGFFTAKVALVWPDRHERLMLVAAMAAIAAGVATALPVML
jgi:hypothetical protein